MHEACPNVFKNSLHTSSLNWYLLCWLLLEYITQVNIWSHTQSLNRVALLLSLGCRGRSSTSPLPSAVDQAELQVSEWQQWKSADKAFSAGVPQPSGLWLGTHQPTRLLIWRAAVMKERTGSSHLAWTIMNPGQMNGFRGQSRKHLAMVIAVRTIYTSRPEERFPCVGGFRFIETIM